MKKPVGIPERVGEFCASRRFLNGARRLLVGFSGGADSTALLLLLRQLWPVVPLRAVHFHHGLRGAAADGDAAWCRAFCAARGIPFTLVRLEVARQRRRGESLEDAARRCRLAWWQAHAAASGTVVALGHHLDDALEDLLLRLGRGAGSSGLVGLRPVRELGGVRVVRPLLCLRRCEIEAFLRGVGVSDWREDETNAQLHLRRNAVRHRWLPLLRETLGTDAGLLATWEALNEDAAFLEAAAARRLGAVRSRAALRRLPPALLPRVLRLWLTRQAGHDVVPSRAAVVRLRAALSRDDEHVREIPFGRGLRVCVGPGGLAWPAPAPAALRPRRWRWREEPHLPLPAGAGVLTAEPVPAAGAEFARCDAAVNGELFALAALPPVLTVRAWRPGDRFRPFGCRGTKKLQDLFTDRRVPRAQRPQVPVVLAGREIIWVAGVGRAEFGRLPSSGWVKAVCLRLLPAAAGADGTGAAGGVTHAPA